MLALLALLAPIQLFAVDAPTRIGGFTLGDDITNYPEIEASNYLREVVISDWHGFRKGIISYGTCAYPGQIVKIRLKYEDKTKDFYDVLLKKFTDKYGKPTEWKGDAFGVLYVWKWHFRDKNDERITMILQHNLRNDDETIGNEVKLSFPERMEDERLCFIEFCEKNKSEEQKANLQERARAEWDYMIPK